MEQIDMDLVAAVEARFEAQNVRIAKLETALREIASYKGDDDELDGTAAEMRRTAAQSLMGSES